MRERNHTQDTIVSGEVCRALQADNTPNQPTLHSDTDFAPEQAEAAMTKVTHAYHAE
jgi:hypothetical protein